ncbi:MAG TPA: hypothetical protein ENK18_04560 [Deltaproteobacteria bacterium]|nr:hypothetical protein [Deltaproteobacteria bacterium]
MSIQQDVASAVAWLAHGQVQQLLQHLINGSLVEAGVILAGAVPDLADACDLTDPTWREALIDELEFRVAGSDDEANPDDVQTREVPDYTRYAPAEG